MEMKMSKKNTFEQKKTHRLDKQLIAYSVAAGAALAAGQSAEAAIIHTPTNVTLHPYGGFLNIDFDADGTNEFVIRVATNPGNTSQVNVLAMTYNATASWRGDADAAPFGNGASALDYGDQVMAGTKWGRKIMGNGGNMAWYYSIGTFGGYFLGTTGKYIGVKFSFNGGTNYGWIQVDVPMDASSATITGYAFNDKADGGIRAGYIVPEAGSLALLALGAADLAAWRRK